MTVTIPIWLILVGSHLLAAVVGWAALTFVLLRLGALIEERGEREIETPGPIL